MNDWDLLQQYVRDKSKEALDELVRRHLPMVHAAALRHERRFTAELSHELRTPLAHLRAEVDLLAGSTRDPDGSGTARSQVIRSEAVGADDLDDLLTSIRRLAASGTSALSS